MDNSKAKEDNRDFPIAENGTEEDGDCDSVTENSFFEDIDDSILIEELGLIKDPTSSELGEGLGSGNLIHSTLKTGRQNHSKEPMDIPFTAPFFDELLEGKRRDALARSISNSLPFDATSEASISSDRAEPVINDASLNEKVGVGRSTNNVSSFSSEPSEILDLDFKPQSLPGSRLNSWVLGNFSNDFLTSDFSPRNFKDRFSSHEFLEGECYLSEKNSLVEASASSCEPLNPCISNCDLFQSCTVQPKVLGIQGKFNPTRLRQKLPSLPYKDYNHYLKVHCMDNERAEARLKASPEEPNSVPKLTTLNQTQEPALLARNLTPLFVSVHEPIPSNAKFDPTISETQPCIKSSHLGALSPSPHNLALTEKTSQVTRANFSSSFFYKEHPNPRKDRNPFDANKGGSILHHSDSSTESSEGLSCSEKVLTDSLLMQLNQDSAYCCKRKMDLKDYNSLSIDGSSKHKSHLQPEPALASELPYEQDIPSLVNSSRSTSCIPIQPGVKDKLKSGDVNDLYGKDAFKRRSLIFEQIEQKLLAYESQPSPGALNSLLQQVKDVQDLLKKGLSDFNACPTVYSGKAVLAHQSCKSCRTKLRHRGKRIFKKHQNLSLNANRPVCRKIQKPPVAFEREIEHLQAQLNSLTLQNDLLTTKLHAFQEFATLRRQVPPALDSQQATNYLIFRDKLIYSLCKS